MGENSFTAKVGRRKLLLLALKWPITVAVERILVKIPRRPAEPMNEGSNRWAR